MEVCSIFIMSQQKSQKSPRDGKHKEGKSMVQFWLEDEVIADLDKRAEKEETNRSDIIRVAISKFLRGDIPAAKEPTTIDMMRELDQIKSAIAKRDAEEKEVKAKAAALSNSSDASVKNNILSILKFVSSVKTNQIAAKLNLSSGKVFTILSALELAGEIKGENDNWSLI
jgi:predicted Rossmann fold nucleotide-binding protein DprA/Smf involved in DNA uptake